MSLLLDPWSLTSFFSKLDLALSVLDFNTYYKQTCIFKAFVIIPDSWALTSSGLFVPVAVDTL